MDGEGWQAMTDIDRAWHAYGYHISPGEFIEAWIHQTMEMVIQMQVELARGR